MPITFKDVGYTYSPKTPFQYEALHHIDVTIKDGSFTAIVGHTGSGKSTLIQHINALLLPTSGSVEINGLRIIAKEKVKQIKKFRKQAGLVFQFPEYQLFEETVEKDVAFGPRNFGDDEKEALRKAHVALERVGIDKDLFARSPFELSGGQRRRVAIAGIIAMEPDILVLDEPTAGLDPRGAREMMELFDEIHQSGTTIVLVTHDMNIVLRFASDVIVMKDGAIVKVTDPMSLFEGDYEDYNLEIPNLYHFAKLLQNGGYSFDMRNIKTIEDIVQVIKAGRHHE